MKLWWLWRKRERELEKEIQHHLRMAETERAERGASARDAQAGARREFGNVGLVKEVTRDTWGWRWLEDLYEDTRYGLRNLRKSLGFTVVTVLTLALGIGANTAIFSVVDAVLFRALPYRDAARLVWATNFVSSQGQNFVFTDVYTGWRTQNQAFENIAAYSDPAEFTLTGAGTPERLRGANVTASFLDVLGVTPQAGRDFLPEEDQPAGAKAVMLSDGVWRSNFGADPKVIGRVIALDDAPFTVVGVLPRDFEFLDNSPADVLVPFQLAASSFEVSNGKMMGRVMPLNIVARLRKGATIASAKSELNTIDKRVAEGLPANLRRLLGDMTGQGHAQVFLLHDHEVSNVRPALLVLLGAVGFVLLIACANVANLQLARAAAREKEVAVRRALGAGRWRLARLFLTESTTMALSGGLAGLLLASWTIRLIHRFAPANIPHLQSAWLDVRVLVFTLVVSLATGILFGLAPVLTAFRVSLSNTLKESSPQSGAAAGTRRAQRALMVTEIALSFVLLSGAGLLVKSFHQLTAIEPGFDPHGVLTARVALPLDQYQSLDSQRAFFQQLVERLQTLPGVASAGATASIPLRENLMLSTIQIVGHPPADFGVPNVPTASINSVTPGYIAALRVRLVEGRFLDERDGANAPSSVVVNQAFVQRYFEKKEDPIGKRLIANLGPKTGGPQTLTIVGVIGNTKQRGLASDIMPEVTASALEWPRSWMTLVLRTSIDPVSLVSAVRKQVSDLDRNLPVFGVQTMDDMLSADVASARFNAGALAGFAGFAVLLAAVGIYGVMVYAVSQRTREMGVRLALGAKRGDILGMILNQGLRLALIGVGLGLAASFGLTRLMSKLLFGVKPSDPETFVLVTAALVAVAVVACMVPARRAMRVDPVIALRYE
ncbi:MAG TPA: ABC transporter permease [Candidatus Acidoferrum sp.]|nr:ABC transporter permease [Candidatus Acidoferrum sp.]